jgi:hypothetical protein
MLQQQQLSHGSAAVPRGCKAGLAHIIKRRLNQHLRKHNKYEMLGISACFCRRCASNQSSARVTHAIKWRLHQHLHHNTRKFQSSHAGQT